eukprot:COSAG02_NODE_95_length_37416_cov_60.512742_7_plen_248_part_00
MRRMCSSRSRAAARPCGLAPPPSARLCCDAGRRACSSLYAAARCSRFARCASATFLASMVNSPSSSGCGRDCCRDEGLRPCADRGGTYPPPPPPRSRVEGLLSAAASLTAGRTLSGAGAGTSLCPGPTLTIGFCPCKTVCENSLLATDSERNWRIRFCITGIFNTWLMFGRFDGSRLSISAISPRSSALNIVGGGVYFPRMIFSTSACMLPASNACLSVVSSYSTQPRLHISLLWSYALSRQISGER